MNRLDIGWAALVLGVLILAAIVMCERPNVVTVTEITPSPTLRVVVIPDRSPVPAYTSTVQPSVQPPEVVSTPLPPATPTSTPSPTPTETPRPATPTAFTQRG